MSTHNLYSLLERAAQGPAENGVLLYQTGKGAAPHFRSYKEVLYHAQQESIRLRKMRCLDNVVVLIYFPHHLSNILEFWSIIAAGGIPCICPPLPKDPHQRRKMLTHLQELLKNPPIITISRLVLEFLDLADLQIDTTDNVVYLKDPRSINHETFPGKAKTEEDIAVLMLTSGSTGNPKAVCLRHGQILASLKGKAKHHGTTEDDVFLNWTGLDHVANLTEIHLHAMSLAAQQVHLDAADILADPVSFLEAIHAHKVTYTFAPNFFLTTLVRSLESLDIKNPLKVELNGNALCPPLTERSINLSSLRAFISGGESNVTEICDKLTQLLWNFGAPRSFIRPGFGMTETCAGSIYNDIDCPSYDIEQGEEFCSLGECIEGIKARVIRSNGTEAKTNEIGSIQVSGPVVFSEYYSDKAATLEAFTADGWFKTGDLGLLDSRGRLRLTGRDKDMIVINGSNYSSQAIEAAIEDSLILGLKSTNTVVFPHRPKGSATEFLCVAYIPTYDSDDVQSRITTKTAISKTVIKYCGIRPFKIIGLPPAQLEKSSLGKFSRSKIRRAFEGGQYTQYEHEDNPMTLTSSLGNSGLDGTNIQKDLLKFFRTHFGADAANLGLNSDLFEIGLSSIDILKLRAHLQDALEIQIPVTIFFSKPVIRDLCQALENLAEKRTYDPVTILQPNGTKTPLFFIHPGVGEVLIFMNLARHIDDRPVYALRARGFDGEEYFSSMQEMITTYYQAIKRVQPDGPYAIAGYSFGSILAFEITKIIEAHGDKVQFLASFDQPPHFKQRARTYDWYEVGLTISFFMGLIPEDYAYKFLPEMRQKTHDEVLDHVLGLADPARLEEVGMTRARLDNWAKLGYQLKVVAWDYDPAGMVANTDVFYTGPLLGIVKARNMKEWFDDYISKWKDFAKDVRFHEVRGTHRTMISPPNVIGFQKLLKAAMKERGL